MSILYRTKIDEHIRQASSVLLLQGGDVVSMRRISIETGIPYNTVRRYVLQTLEGPNFAIVDRIRRYLNQWAEMGEAGYVYAVESELSPGARG